ncbi:MAG TPA: hypothetical protein VKV33_01930 [Streptosporangiaceae bacterium]|nr:hypothetical protein [Streptosporangiaceae bacterium]
MLSDLAALTPPAVVCAAFLIGLVLLVRREMAPKRRVREEQDSEHDISGNNDIIDAKVTASATAADDQDAMTGSADERGSSE